MKAGQPLATIFALPLLLAMLSIVGLVAALTGDGWRDALSWGALASPIAAILWACARRRS
ncbi:hypothetical protein [Rhizorhabdus sp. FW153]|uniref:hypothetical protein n=1 Tax=Rhizorhabdus sp. FW153 TaxID=3400216 RepID=UPI003CE961B8